MREYPCSSGNHSPQTLMLQTASFRSPISNSRRSPSHTQLSFQRPRRIDTSKHAIRQRRLKPQGLADRRIHPHIQIIWLRQNHRHGFRMDGSNFPVRLGGQKSKQVIRCLAISQFPHGCPSAPYPGKESQRLSVAAGKPHRP